MPATPSRCALESYFTTRADRALLERLDTGSIPTHVAIIMDGNGRWAEKRSLSRSAGHRAGAHAVHETIEAALELGIGYLTLFSFSSENWRRPADEVEGLMNLFAEVIMDESMNLLTRGVRVRVIGSASGVPDYTMSAFRTVEALTRDGSTMTLVIALNYGGRMEIVEAVRSLAERVESGELVPADIDEVTVSDALFTAGIPDPDLVIRTSGELRISNFLLWQIAYAEFWITATLWPDFRKSHLLKALVEFQGRSRRFGAAE